MSTEGTTSTAWKPQPGDSITLTIEDLTEHDAGWGPYPILEGADDASQHTVTVHCFHDVLKNELARLAPNVGDTLTITYRGKHPEKGYHQYKVRRPDGSGPGIDWAKYGGAPPTQDPPASDVPADFPGYGEPPKSQDKPKDDGDEPIPF